MNVIVVGCGRLGLRLAEVLDSWNHQVAVVEKQMELLNELPENFDGLKILGTPIDRDVLASAGCENADVLAAVTMDDNINIMVSQMAKEFFNVPRIYTRILDPTKEAVFHKMGMHTICPTSLAADTLFDIIVNDEKEIKVFNLGNHFADFMVRPVDPSFLGRVIDDIPVRRNEMLFAIQKEDGEIVLANTPQLKIAQGDSFIYGKIR